MEFLFEYFVSNAILAAGLALLVAGVTRLWRNPQLAHALWIVVLLKLISPPLLPVPVGPLLAPARQRPPLNHGNMKQQPMPAFDLAAGTDGLKPLASSEVSKDPRDGPGHLEAWETFTDGGTLETSLVVEERMQPARSWLPLVAMLWLSGTLLRLILVSRRVIRFHRIACGMAPADASIVEQAAGLAQQLKLERCPDIRVVEGRIPPMVWSASWRPLVLLPVELLTRLDDHQRAALIMHELAHIRRRDHWVRWLEMGVLALCWWNPVGWWARARIQRAEEECCDGLVVRTLPHCARSYGRALLETVEFLHERRQPLPAMASGFGHVPLVKRRIEMIVKQQVAHRLSWPGGLLVLLVGAVVLPLSAQSPDTSRNPRAAREPAVAVLRNPRFPIVPSSEDSKQLEAFWAYARELRQLNSFAQLLGEGTGTPALVFPPPRSGIWRERSDHKVDGNLDPQGWWDYQLDFRDDKVTGHVVKISDGKSSDAIMSGELINARPNPSGKKYGRFVSVLILRHDTSDNGHFNVSIFHRVSEDRFVGTSLSSNGWEGDIELVYTGPNPEITNAQKTEN